jgi:hypothetical protein
LANFKQQEKTLFLFFFFRVVMRGEQSTLATFLITFLPLLAFLVFPRVCQLLGCTMSSATAAMRPRNSLARVLVNKAMADNILFITLKL